MSLENNPIIITPRMIIRPLDINDAKELSEATFETWEDLNDWMQWANDKNEKTDIENCERYCEACKNKFNLKKDFTFACLLKENHQFVACIRIAYLNADEDNYEFCGIWCRKKYQQQGITSEAVNAIIRYFFEIYKAQNFIISHADGNYKSQKMILHLGFHSLEKKIKHITLPNKEKRDAFYYELKSMNVLPNLNVIFVVNE